MYFYRYQSELMLNCMTFKNDDFPQSYLFSSNITCICYRYLYDNG